MTRKRNYNTRRYNTEHPYRPTYVHGYHCEADKVRKVCQLL